MFILIQHTDIKTIIVMILIGEPGKLKLKQLSMRWRKVYFNDSSLLFPLS